MFLETKDTFQELLLLLMENKLILIIEFGFSLHCSVHLHDPTHLLEIKILGKRSFL